MKVAGGVLVGLTLGYLLAQARPTAEATPYRQLDLLAETYGQIRAHYVDDVPPSTLFRGAVSGMVQALDPHSALLDPDAVAQFHADAQGDFAGVGMEVVIKHGHLTIVAPLPGTPASHAGLRPNDRIRAIDGERTRGQSMKVIGERLRGDPGTVVTLTIRRNEGPPFDVPITRAMIHIDPVQAEDLGDGIAWIRILTFQTDTADRVDEAIARLEPKGIVLDLRNNPGGLVRAAVDVADRFLDGGVIVSSRGRAEDATWRGNAGQFTEARMVVLINSGSASAAEIVAGALQDRKRATLMGTPSFGKGSIQTLYPLSDGSGVKLTIARYHLPSGRAIQARGLQPDVALDPPDDGIARVRERDLAGVLDNPEPAGEKGPMPVAPPALPAVEGSDPWLAHAKARLLAPTPAPPK